ncbi:hypothetical protein M2302_006319 [Micromonospora sp. A200]|uniref:hypothetical protein n=1 Tax=Micromonospora sp. A200 TaxID=2940568 RepID=UPI002476E86A|nr:hypothetical protein [Micromonospora sp. A200]MDH6466113.1 hypothetical protein [Micromonospora sp. A200]
MTVGDLITVHEAFYRFGTGPLLMRITAVLNRRMVEGSLWVELSGQGVRLDGSIDSRQRFALVRLDRTVVVGR